MKPNFHRHGDACHCLPFPEIQVALFDEGWVPTRSPTIEDFKAGVLAVQRFHGLPETGWVGYGTARALGLLTREPLFCGLPENIVVNGRPQWADASNLTWALDGTIPGFPDLKDSCERGVKMWEPHGKVKLTYNGNPRTCNLLITTANLGGPGGVLADCELPYGSQSQLRMRLDTSERWKRDIDPDRVIAHECGHALGILHLPGSNVALMNAMYSRNIDRPQPLDARECDVRYPGGPVVPVPPPTPAPSATDPVYKVKLPCRLEAA